MQENVSNKCDAQPTREDFIFLGWTQMFLSSNLLDFAKIELPELGIPNFKPSESPKMPELRHYIVQTQASNVLPKAELGTSK